MSKNVWIVHRAGYRPDDHYVKADHPTYYFDKEENAILCAGDCTIQSLLEYSVINPRLDSALGIEYECLDFDDWGEKNNCYGPIAKAVAEMGVEEAQRYLANKTNFDALMHESESDDPVVFYEAIELEPGD